MKTALVHLAVSVMFPPFSSNISGHLALNTPLTIAITVFWVTAPPLTPGLCRRHLTLVISSSLILDGLLWRGKAKKIPTSLLWNALIFHLRISNNLSFSGVIWVLLWSSSPSFWICMFPSVVSHVLFNHLG